MRRVPTQQAANTNDRIVFSRLGQRASGQGNFKRPGDPNQRDVFFLGPGTNQPIVGTLKKSFRNERIKPRDNNCEPLSRAAKPAFDSRNRRLGRPLGTDFFLQRFSP
jgi:hypothetical protein